MKPLGSVILHLLVGGNVVIKENLPQVVSSDPSLQSFSPLQNKPLSIHWVSPHANSPSEHTGLSVNSMGLILRSLFFSLQFFTASLQSQVCFSMSKYKPAGQRMACRPCNKHFKVNIITGRRSFCYICYCCWLIDLRLLMKIFLKSRLTLIVIQLNKG